MLKYDIVVHKNSFKISKKIKFNRAIFINVMVDELLIRYSCVGLLDKLHVSKE